MVTREDVIAGFRLVFQRVPENEDVIRVHQAIESPELLGRALMSSEEFRWNSKAWLPLWPESKWVCAPIRQGLYMWLDLHDSYVAFGCLADRYEENETQFVLRNLKRGDCFLDCGANIGWFTLLAAQTVGPLGYVIAFEPRQDIFAMLERSVKANHFTSRCRLYPVALGDYIGKGELLIDPVSVNPGGTRMANGYRADEEPAPQLTRQNVEIRPLDTLRINRRIRLIKLDVEGAEPMVMRGARRLLERHKPIVLSEIHARALQQTSHETPETFHVQMEEYGYRCHELTNGCAGRVLKPDELWREDPFNVVFLHRVYHADHPDVIEQTISDQPQPALVSDVQEPEL